MVQSKPVIQVTKPVTKETPVFRSPTTTKKVVETTDEIPVVFNASPDTVIKPVITPSSRPEIASPSHPVFHPPSRQIYESSTPTGFTSNPTIERANVQGVFKASEVDIVYLTTRTGHKYRGRFRFEWELIEEENTGTDINGISLQKDAKCSIEDFDKASKSNFIWSLNTDASAGIDSSRAIHLYEKIIAALKVFGEKSSEKSFLCPNGLKKFACQSVLYSPETDALEVVGTLKSIISEVLSFCDPDFSQKWINAVNELVKVMGEKVPTVLIQHEKQIQTQEFTLTNPNGKLVIAEEIKKVEIPSPKPTQKVPTKEVSRAVIVTTTTTTTTSTTTKTTSTTTSTTSSTTTSATTTTSTTRTTTTKTTTTTSLIQSEPGILKKISK